MTYLNVCEDSCAELIIIFDVESMPISSRDEPIGLSSVEPQAHNRLNHNDLPSLSKNEPPTTIPSPTTNSTTVTKPVVDSFRYDKSTRWLINQ